MKRLRKSFFMMLISIYCLLSASCIAYAEEKEASLFTLWQAQDVTVTITYGVDDVSFTLISPSGQLITKDTDEENITVFHGSTSTLVFLGQAEPGEWKIRYDKGSNESIGVSADVQDTSFFITEYQAGALTNGKIPVNFVVSANSDIIYDYRISLTADTQSLNGKELARGRGRVGEPVSLEVDLTDANTYDEYYLLLYVSYDLNGSEIFDYSYSDSFAYTNPNTPAAMENVDIIIDQDRHMLDVNWKEYFPGSAKSVYLAAYIGEECISSGEYLKDSGYSTRIPFEAGDKVRLEISYKDRKGMVSEILKKEVDTATEILILPESGKVNSDMWTFEYKGADDTEVLFKVNDQEYTIILNGDGSKYITLPESRNNIAIRYRDKNGNLHEHYRVANISNELPVIELLRQVDGVTTEENVIMVSGRTNTDTLTINGQSIEVQNGEFVHSCSLQDGKNEIVLEAVLGDNVSQIHAVVTKTVAKEGNNWIYLFAGLAVSLVGILLTAWFTWRRSRRIAKGEKVRETKGGLIVSWIFAVLLWGAWIALLMFENSAGYLELAYESLKKANSLLTLEKILMFVAIGWSGLTLLRTLLYALVGAIRKKRTEGVNEEVKRHRKKLFKKDTGSQDTENQ